MEQTKKVYLLLRYAGSGSGSLTYPEDFQFVGAYFDEALADAACSDLLDEIYDEARSNQDDPNYLAEEDPDVDCAEVREIDLIG